MTKLERQTASNRIAATADLNSIIAIAESQIVRVRNIPILDDEEHADIVQGYTDRIHEILMDMCDLCSAGKEKIVFEA